MSPGSDGADGLEAELDALYTAPLDQFVERRDALAKTLRERGETDASRRVKALRKPGVVAWAINRLHLERGGLAEIAAASEALRAALQSARSTAERRVAIESRRRALERATSAIVEILEAAGGAVSPALLRRIERTVLAVSSGRSAGDEEVPRPGRLDRELEPPGFEAILDPPGLTLPPATLPPVATASPPSAATATAAGKAGPARAEPPATATAKLPPPVAVSAAARGNVRDFQKEAALRKAQAALDQADGELERATNEVEAARMRVTAAEKALVATRKDVDAARRELAAVRSRRDQARRELDRVKKERDT